MDRHEFEEKLFALGGDLNRWPPADRDAAERLLAEDAACRALLAEVIADDDAIRSATLAPLDAALVGRIMAATRAPSRTACCSPAGARCCRPVRWPCFVAGVGFKTGYDDGVGFAGETDLAAMVTGEFGLGTPPADRTPRPTAAARCAARRLAARQCLRPQPLCRRYGWPLRFRRAVDAAFRTGFPARCAAGTAGPRRRPAPGRRRSPHRPQPHVRPLPPPTSRIRGARRRCRRGAHRH